MESIDITSDELKEKGFQVRKEGNTIALYHEGRLCVRSTIYKNDWNKTVKQVEKQFTGSGTGIDNLTLQHLISCMSSNYDKLFNEGVFARTAKQEQPFLTEMAPKATRASCSMEEWRATLQSKYEYLKSVTEQNIPGLWLPLEFAISIKCILNIRNITLPVIGLILGPPSSLKSVAVNMAKGARDTFGVG